MKFEQLVRFTLFSLLLVLNFSCAKNSAQNHNEIISLDDRSIIVKDAEGFLRQKMQENEIPGLGFAIINNNQVTATFHLGIANKQDSSLVNENTLFEAASLSKAVFAFYCYTLAEKGIIKLDSPIIDYIDTLASFQKSSQEPYRDLDIYLDFKNGYSEEYFRKITFNMLLNHSSGLMNWWDAEPSFAFEPGSGFLYSDDGYILLQRVVEHILDKRMAELINNEQLKQWGMAGSSFLLQPMPQNSVAGHNKSGEFQRDFWMPAEALAHGSLATTPQDFAAFLIHISSTATQNSFYQTMYEAQVALPHPKLSWGPGFAVEQNHGKHLIWHWGNNTYTRNLVVYSPEDKWGFVLFTNSINGLELATLLMEYFAGNKDYELDKWVH